MFLVPEESGGDPRVRLCNLLSQALEVVNFHLTARGVMAFA
jgi:hypothetical protein